MNFGKKQIHKVASDLDGTLTNSLDVYAWSHNITLASLGAKLPCREKEFRMQFFSKNPNKRFRDYIQHTIDTFGLGVTIDEYKALLDKTSQQMISTQSEYKCGAEDIIKFSQMMGVPFGLATNSGNEAVNNMAQAPAIKNSRAPFESFDYRVTRDDVQRKKPAGDIYRKAMGSTKAIHTLVLEDNVKGMTAALRAGIPKSNIVGVYDAYNKHDIVNIRKSCGMFIEHFDQLKDALEKSN